MDTQPRKVEQQIDSLLARWRTIITGTTATNEELAIESIDSLYRIVNHQPAPIILWCQSPFQMQVLQPLIANTLNSPGWARLAANMKSNKPQTAEWESQWQIEWAKLAPEVSRLYREFILCEQYPNPLSGVEESVKQVAFDTAKQHMRLILSDGRISPGSGNVNPRSKNKSTKLDGKKSLLPTPIDVEFARHLFRLYIRIDQLSGSKLNINMATTTALGFGVIDHRLLTQFLPIGQELFEHKHDSRTKALIDRAKQGCAELETISGAMLMWLFGIFRQRRPTAIVNPRASRVQTFVGAVDTVTRIVHQEVVPDKRPHPPQVISCWLPYSAMFLPFALSCRLVDPQFFGALQEEIDCWAYLAHAAFGYAFSKQLCFVCKKPTVFQTNELGRPHRRDGPAAAWVDGFELYAWRGINIDSEFIKNPNSITYERINQETNSEIRRVMIDIYGESRYLKDSNAQIIHEDEYGTLFRQEIPGDEALVMVRVRNSTPEPDGTFRYYFLRVPPNTRRAREAVAWTFGMEQDERQYEPDLET